MYIYSISAKIVHFFKKRVVILWLSYGYLMGILWQRKVKPLLKDASRPVLAKDTAFFKSGAKVQIIFDIHKKKRNIFLYFFRIVVLFLAKNLHMSKKSSTFAR